MNLTPSGVPTLDALLGGGLVIGDNIVWVGDRVSTTYRYCRHFLSQPAPRRRLLRLKRSGVDPVPGVDVTDLSAAVRADDLDAVGAALLDGHDGEGSRLVIDGLDELTLRFGVPATVGFYRRVCPRLFDLGTVAYWTASREVLTPAAIDNVSRIAQCVFEVRPDRLRIAKAEGRPSKLQGATVEVDDSVDPPVLSREHTVGRIGEGLRRLRHDRRLTQSDIAQLAGVTPAAISQAETGRRGLSLDTLVPLCEALGIGIDDLLGSPGTRDYVLARHDRGGEGTTTLFDDPAGGVQAFLVTLPTGASGAPPFTHKGLELVLVAQGLVLLDLGATTPVARQGDALMATRVPIRGWTNLGTTDAQIFWIAVG